MAYIHIERDEAAFLDLSPRLAQKSPPPSIRGESTDRGGWVLDIPEESRDFIEKSKKAKSMGVNWLLVGIRLYPDQSRYGGIIVTPSLSIFFFLPRLQGTRDYCALCVLNLIWYRCL